MTKSGRFYIGMVVVFILGLVVYALGKHVYQMSLLGTALQSFSAIPLVGALVGALWQMFRDQVAREHAVAIFEADKLFVVGASSHMANVAFDKHTLFCEEYLKEVNLALDTLIREGPTEKAVSHATIFSTFDGLMLSG